MIAFSVNIEAHDDDYSIVVNYLMYSRVKDDDDDDDDVVVCETTTTTTTSCTSR
jgi:hypothetical protein